MARKQNNTNVVTSNGIDITTIVTDFQNGEGITKLAKEYNLSYKQMRRILEKEGVYEKRDAVSRSANLTPKKNKKSSKKEVIKSKKEPKENKSMAKESSNKHSKSNSSSKEKSKNIKSSIDDILELAISNVQKKYNNKIPKVSKEEKRAFCDSIYGLDNWHFMTRTEIKNEMLYGYSL